MSYSGSEQDEVLNPYSADVIWQKIEDTFNSNDFAGLHQRMGIAQDVYDMGITLPDRSSIAKDSPVYTSVIPREYVDKITTQLSETSIVVNTSDSEEPIIRQATEDLRHFVKGCFATADKEALRQALPQVVSQMAYQVTLRGWLVARAMMNIKVVQNIDTPSPEIEVWDSMDSVWERDINGLLWMARKLTLPSNFDGRIRDRSIEGVTVYEYIDRQRYCVVTRDGHYQEVKGNEGDGLTPNTGQTMFVVAPVEHYVVDSEGRQSLPGVVLPVGSRTRAHGTAFGLDELSKMGSGVLETLIPVVEQYNLMATNWLTQEQQDTERKLIYQTNNPDDETREAIRKPGEDVTIKNDEDIRPMSSKSGVSPNSQALRDLTVAETELATFTDIIRGTSGRNLSGYAIRQLSINARQKIQPSLSTMERGIEAISLLIRGHFQTGAFGILPVVGRHGLNNTYFEKNIYPDILRFAGGFDIKLRPRREKLIPEDVNVAVQMVGILPLRTILTDVLDIDDPEEQLRELTIEQISQADPQLLLSRAIEAYGETGQIGQAQYLEQIFNLNIQNLKTDLGLQILYKKFQTAQLLASLEAGDAVTAEIAVENLRRLGVTLLGQPTGSEPLSIAGLQDPKAGSEADPNISRRVTPLKGVKHFFTQRGAQVNQENASLDRGGQNGRV